MNIIIMGLFNLNRLKLVLKIDCFCVSQYTR